MTNEDIIRMAREANIGAYINLESYLVVSHLERFADLVAAAERNRTWTQDHWTEYERSIAAEEREACAKTAMELLFVYIGSYPINEQFADAIRARGQE